MVIVESCHHNIHVASLSTVTECEIGGVADLLSFVKNTIRLRLLFFLSTLLFLYVSTSVFYDKSGQSKRDWRARFYFKIIAFFQQSFNE